MLLYVRLAYLPARVAVNRVARIVSQITAKSVSQPFVKIVFIRANFARSANAVYIWLIENYAKTVRKSRKKRKKRKKKILNKILAALN